jgi:hypothetical protein
MGSCKVGDACTLTLTPPVMMPERAHLPGLAPAPVPGLVLEQWLEQERCPLCQHYLQVTRQIRNFQQGRVSHYLFTTVVLA